MKPRVHTIEFYWYWLKYIEDDLVWLAATLWKALWIELHVGPTSRARHKKIKSCVHTIKFYRNWLKFVGDALVWLVVFCAKLCG